jgi:hypothetical protein
MIDRPLGSPLSLNGGGLGLAGLAETGASTPVNSPRNSWSIENSDGSVDVYLEDEPPTVEDALAKTPFSANLAETLPDNMLGQIASDIRFAVDEDRQGRRDWEDALTKGLDLLGIKDEQRTTPWPGACGVVHPMLMEAAVRFQSKCVTRMFPPTGPADAKVIGESNTEKIQQAKRVAQDLNYWLTDRMTEYRDEAEQLLFAIPVDGSAFKKVFYDPLLKRPVAQFVPASDFLMPYGFPNLETCPRYTHVMRKGYGDIVELQNIGFYRDVQLQRHAAMPPDRVEEKIQRLSGMSPSYSHHDLLPLWEVSTNLGIEGSSRPYVITLEENSNQILSIYRNWREGDPDFAKVLSWVHYRYVPWKGAYGLGLIHLIGGIGHSTTSILRQLVDAGTLSNLPGGLKSRQLRIKGDSDPIQPGEFRDVDVPAGKVLDSIAFLPYKEPSAVLFQLLQMLVEEGKSFASIAELDITTSAQNAPVGTILALIERATEVITAVQSRMHLALARELALIAELIRDHTSSEYDYDPPGGMPRSVKQADYGELISIQPVSDPASSTMAQRVMQYQAAIQLSSQAPQLYDLPLLHRSMMEVLGIDNASQIVPDKTSAEPMDPVAENMALITSKPVKAFEWQNHMAHMAVHQAFLNDPGVQQATGQNPLGPSIIQATWAHLNEHLAFEYRKQIQDTLGTPLPPLGQRLPADAESQLSNLVQDAAQKLLQQNQAEQQQQQQQQQQTDPILQQQQQEFGLKQQVAQAKMQTDSKKLDIDQQAVTQKGQLEAAKLASEHERDLLKIHAGAVQQHASDVAESHRQHAHEHAETTRHLMSTRVDREKHNLNAQQRSQQAAQQAEQKSIDRVLRNLPSEGPETAPAPDQAPPLPNA